MLWHETLWITLTRWIIFYEELLSSDRLNILYYYVLNKLMVSMGTSYAGSPQTEPKHYWQTLFCIIFLRFCLQWRLWWRSFCAGHHFTRNASSPSMETISRFCMPSSPTHRAFCTTCQHASIHCCTILWAINSAKHSRLIFYNNSVYWRLFLLLNVYPWAIHVFSNNMQLTSSRLYLAI